MKSDASTMFLSERAPSVAPDRKAGVGKDGIPHRQLRWRRGRAGRMGIHAWVHSAAFG